MKEKIAKRIVLSRINTDHIRKFSELDVVLKEVLAEFDDYDLFNYLPCLPLVIELRSKQLHHDAKHYLNKIPDVLLGYEKEFKQYGFTYSYDEEGKPHNLKIRL